MKRRDAELDPELAALLEFREVERRIPADARARALARARASIAAGGAIPLAAAGGAIPPTPLPARPSPAPVAASRRGRLIRVAAAASIALVVGAVGAVAALRGRAAPGPALAVPAPPQPAEAVRDEGVRALEDQSPATAVPRAAAAKPARPARLAGGADPFTAELELLQRAQAAYTRRDFSGALVLVAEHARRFPRGHLAEEREALHVRLLARTGRAGEANRAAADFAARFPRSVLLPRVREASDDLQ
jgi:hypothetical protein